MNWSKLSPAEKDKLVAEHFFGLMDIDVIQRPKGTEGYKCDLSGCWIVQRRRDEALLGLNYDTREEALAAYLADPHYAKPYSTSIADAMLVLEKQETWWCGQCVVDGKKEFWCTIITESDGDDVVTSVEARASTLPDAICLATLRARKIQIEE